MGPTYIRHVFDRNSEIEITLREDAEGAQFATLDIDGVTLCCDRVPLDSVRLDTLDFEPLRRIHKLLGDFFDSVEKGQQVISKSE